MLVLSEIVQELVKCRGYLGILDGLDGVKGKQCLASPVGRTVEEVGRRGGRQQKVQGGKWSCCAVTIRSCCQWLTEVRRRVLHPEGLICWCLFGFAPGY